MTKIKLAWAAAMLTLILVTTALASTVLAKGDDQHGQGGVRGGGTSLVAGGTGSPSFVPVMTTFAFNWSGGTGRFECLALAPSAAAGKPGSGNFDTNAMYVTGTITSAEVKGQTAVLKGKATVTGLGAGSDRPYTLTVTSGGPGATLVLNLPAVLSLPALTFNEIVVEGAIEF
ncbi:MAG: hypothetical protein M3T56_01125 [Chloroflexota bacterium]|nr:hypothetical protein [Chloroflexota bacterium]